ncbi:uncharacterized protein [Lepisosteus oculatus]|uniref:uncharacterized protein n=1 Tax=Lepisosteus oculatus TaxID=7918 RepID=UPI0035F519FF
MPSGTQTLLLFTQPESISLQAVFVLGRTQPQKACEGSKTPHRKKDRWAVRSGKVDTVSTAGTPDSTGDPGAQQKGQLDTRPYSQGEEVSCVVQTELPQHSPSSAQQSAPDRGGAADGRQVQEKTSPRTSSPGLPDTELSGSDTLAAHNSHVFYCYTPLYKNNHSSRSADRAPPGGEQQHTEKKSSSALAPVSCAALPTLKGQRLLSASERPSDHPAPGGPQPGKQLLHQRCSAVSLWPTVLLQLHPEGGTQLGHDAQDSAAQSADPALEEVLLEEPEVIPSGLTTQAHCSGGVQLPRARDWTAEPTVLLEGLSEEELLAAALQMSLQSGPSTAPQDK